jgi:hypothetical protein
MVRKRTLTSMFLYSLLLATLLMVWLMIDNVDGGVDITKPLYQFVIVMACLSFVISVFSMHKLLVDIRSHINGVKEKEQNIKECYQYDQLLNPPIMNN